MCYKSRHFCILTSDIKRLPDRNLSIFNLKETSQIINTAL